MPPADRNAGRNVSLAAASLESLRDRYGFLQRRSPPPAALETLDDTLDKLARSLFRIAVFGRVGRGKSAVINALIGQPLLETGPLHGVTRSPIAIRWIPYSDGRIQIELIDTPGLDEVEGEARAIAALDTARQADLILFVVAGDITRIEYDALVRLRSAQKPLVLVFNKIDLYPESDREAIYQKLQGFAANDPDNPVPIPNEIVCVAARPNPIVVEVERKDGNTYPEEHTPPPQIDELKQTLLAILNREGRDLLALNALIRGREAAQQLTEASLDERRLAAEDLIWEFARYKALAVALNPIAFIDVLGGSIADLALIRSLAKLYGLPMTGYQAGRLWRRILWSGGGVLLSEWMSNALFGIGKSAAAIAPGAFFGWVGAATTQAAFAGYGTYTVGSAARVYLERGCTWGEMGPDTIVREILARVDRDTILYRLRRELSP